MQIIDSHLHFDSFHEKGETADLIARAADAGVSPLIAIGGSDDANRLAVDLAASYPRQVYGVVGYDRDEAEHEHDLEALHELAGGDGVVGIGETGLDYHYTADTADAQKRLFAANLDIAARVGKPVIIHSREADEDTLKLLEEYAARWPRKDAPPGVLHCFTGSLPFARELVDMGFMISFSGILTFKNAAALREVAETVPDDRLLIETDSPYLAPVPYRGKRNEPAYVVEVARLLAELRGTDIETIAALTTANALRFFSL
ncbi:MAG: TatD DNase family protein [Kiritimatiellia bacterium]|jgi:TatD DNase family protein